MSAQFEIVKHPIINLPQRRNSVVLIANNNQEIPSPSSNNLSDYHEISKSSNNLSDYHEISKSSNNLSDYH
jgi:hypothetical protein